MEELEISKISFVMMGKGDHRGWRRCQKEEDAEKVNLQKEIIPDVLYRTSSKVAERSLRKNPRGKGDSVSCKEKEDIRGLDQAGKQNAQFRATVGPPRKRRRPRVIKRAEAMDMGQGSRQR